MDPSRSPTARHNNPGKGRKNEDQAPEVVGWCCVLTNLAAFNEFEVCCVCSPELDEEFLSPQAAVTNDRVGQGWAGQIQTNLLCID